MLHFLYVGHFVHQGSFIKLDKQPDGSLQPAIDKPLSTEAIRSALDRRGLNISTIPDDWHVWLDNGYIACDAVTPSGDAIDFIHELAQETGCDLADYSSQTLMTPEEYAWTPEVRSSSVKSRKTRAKSIRVARRPRD